MPSRSTRRAALISLGRYRRHGQRQDRASARQRRHGVQPRCQGRLRRVAPFVSEITPEVSGIFSYANDDKTLGVGLNASYQKRHSGSVQDTENDWNIQAWDGTRRALRPDATVTERAVGQLYGIPNDIRYAFSDFERERINAQAVVQFAPTEALTLTLDYTLAATNSQRIAASRPSGCSAKQLRRLEFDTDDAWRRRYSCATGRRQGLRLRAARNEQKNELNSIGFNAEWKVTDNFSLALDSHNSKPRACQTIPPCGESVPLFSFAGTNCPTMRPVQASGLSSSRSTTACRSCRARSSPPGGRGCQHERQHKCGFHWERARLAGAPHRNPGTGVRGQARPPGRQAGIRKWPIRVRRRLPQDGNESQERLG